MGGTQETVTGFSIGEVEKLTKIKAHILRYWERALPFLRPQKNAQGKRLYTYHDLDLLYRIKYLTETRRFSLEDAGQQLLADLASQGDSRHIIELSGIRRELLDAYRLLQEHRSCFTLPPSIERECSPLLR